MVLFLQFKAKSNYLLNVSKFGNKFNEVNTVENLGGVCYKIFIIVTGFYMTVRKFAKSLEEIIK